MSVEITTQTTVKRVRRVTLDADKITELLKAWANTVHGFGRGASVEVEFDVSHDELFHGVTLTETKVEQTFEEIDQLRSDK